MRINSYGNGFSNIIAFKGNGARNDQGNDGDRIPKITLYGPNRILEITNSVNGDGNYFYKTHEKYDLDKWYNIEIEQKELSGKVRFSVTISRAFLNQLYVRYTSGLRLTEERFTVARTLSPGCSKM